MEEKGLIEAMEVQEVRIFAKRRGRDRDGLITDENGEKRRRNQAVH